MKHKVKINTKILKALNPCSNRWKNYLKHYKDFDGDLVQFLKLEKISLSDKWWVLRRKLSELPEDLLRHFAFACASSVVDDCGVSEIKEYLTLTMLIYESGEISLKNDGDYQAADQVVDHAACQVVDYAAYQVVDYAAYQAADYAAYQVVDYAAYWAADYGKERQLQIDCLIWMIEE